MARFPLGTLKKHAGSDLPYKRTKATGPTINRGKGNNNAATPMVFIRSVEAKFGKLEWDLAAHLTNQKAPKWLGPGSPVAYNSFTVDWHKLGGLLWLNPPFTTITPWARKCAQEVQLGARILLLIPASVGANYYWDWIVPFADVYSVGRMVFDDCYDKYGKLITTPYPKDLILCHYELGATGRSYADHHLGGRAEIIRWRWQDGA